jgi:hypothetical protein
MDRTSLDPLFIKEQTIRDGEALAKQAQEGTFSIVLYVIALLSLSMAMYLLVMNRRIREGELESVAEDQTEEVLEELEKGKMLPAIDSTLPAPTGLVSGVPQPNPSVVFSPNVEPTPASLSASLSPSKPGSSSPGLVQNITYNITDSAVGAIPTTNSVNDGMSAKAPPPLPPTGLPEGWTLDQWNHFGWQYVESMKK